MAKKLSIWFMDDPKLSSSGFLLGLLLPKKLVQKWKWSVECHWISTPSNDRLTDGTTHKLLWQMRRCVLTFFFQVLRKRRPIYIFDLSPNQKETLVS